MDPAKELELSALSLYRPIRDACALGDSDVQRFYSGRTVFLTGGSGFLGKQLIEKLFRSCKISKVYMLLRAKKGKGIQERLLELTKESVFDTLREEQPDFADKIFAIEGDVAEIDMGIRDEDWKKLSEEVEVIFHVAATTRFDEALRVATLINLRGTRECLKLGKACNKLSSYVHVSTAYTHATTLLVRDEVEEQFYRSPVLPDTMISMAEHMEEDRLVKITKDLIRDWPNTYCFTKAIAEELIRTTSEGLPICIVRPGIVMTSYSEPTPGWVDKSAVYSAVGLLLGVGMGLIHCIHCNVDVKVGLIPCDYVNNATIVAGREASVAQRKGGNNTKIYTVSTTNRNPVTWRHCAAILRTVGVKYTTPKSLYYTYAIETSNKIWFNILTYFLHVLPAFLADCVSVLLGKERRFVKLTTKVHNMCNALAYFIINEWQLKDDNTRKLYKGLCKRDQVEFNFDVTNIDWIEYIVINWCLGIRKHLIKDGLKDTEYGIKKQKALQVLHYGLMFLYVVVIWKCLSYFFG